MNIKHLSLPVAIIFACAALSMAQRVGDFESKSVGRSQESNIRQKRHVIVEVNDGAAVTGTLVQSNLDEIQVDLGDVIRTIKLDDIKSIGFQSKKQETIEASSSAQLTPQSAREAIRALMKISGAVEVGVTYFQYGSLVIDAKAKVDEALDSLPAGTLKSELNLAIEEYALAKQIWNTKINRQLIMADNEPGRALISKYSVTPIKKYGKHVIPQDELLTAIWREARTHIDRASFLARLYPFLEGQNADGISLLFSTRDFFECHLFDRHEKSLANSQDAKSFIYVPCFQNG